MKICVVGSGLVGSLLATLLAEAGFEVDIYEKRKDPRKDPENRGRSIALSLSDRGWKALRRAGLEKTVRKNVSPAYGRMVHQKDGTMYSQDYGDGKQAIHTVNRNYLNTVLLKKAEKTGRVSFFFEYACESVDKESGTIVFCAGKDKKKIEKHYDHIIAADGIFSAIRKRLEKEKVWNFESLQLDLGYKELRIPINAKTKRILDHRRVHIWPRKNSFLIAFPTIEGDFVCTLFLPLTGKNSLASLTTKDRLLTFFKQEYNDLIALVPHLERNFFKNPESMLTQVKGAPWNYKDKVVLVGDACHAVAPFYGMGMNVGFEDCDVFMDLLDVNNGDFSKVFEVFGKMRKPDTDAITDLSSGNFDSLGESPDPAYQTKWRLERKVWELFPKAWMPGYALIAFSDIPLARAAIVKEKQDRIVDELARKHPKILDLNDRQIKTLVDLNRLPLADSKEKTKSLKPKNSAHQMYLREGSRQNA